MKRIVAAVAVAALTALPGVASAEEPGPIVRTEPCPPGYTGRIILVGDRLGWWGCYRLP